MVRPASPPVESRDDSSKQVRGASKWQPRTNASPRPADRPPPLSLPPCSRGWQSSCCKPPSPPPPPPGPSKSCQAAAVRPSPDRRRGDSNLLNRVPQIHGISHNFPAISPLAFPGIAPHFPGSKAKMVSDLQQRTLPRRWASKLRPPARWREKEWRKPGKEEEEEEEERQEGIMMAVDDSEGSVVSEFQRKKGRFKGQKGPN